MWPVRGSALRIEWLLTGTVMARTRATIAEPGTKTGVTRTFAPSGTPSTVTDPCSAMAAEAASMRVSVTVAPSSTLCTVVRAVVAWSGDETGAAASLAATRTGAARSADRAERAADRGAGHLTATTDAPGEAPGSGKP